MTIPLPWPLSRVVVPNMNTASSSSSSSSATTPTQLKTSPQTPPPMLKRRVSVSSLLRHYEKPGVAPPSSRVDPSVKQQDGLSMTLWSAAKLGVVVAFKGEFYFALCLLTAAVGVRVHNLLDFILGCGMTLEITEALLPAATVALGPSMVELDTVCIRLRMSRILRSLVGLWFETRSCDCLETDLIGSAGSTPRRTGQLSANGIMACNAELQAFRFIDGSCIRTSPLLWWWLFGSRMMTCRFWSFVCLLS